MDDELLKTRISDYLVEVENRPNIFTETKNVGLRISHFTWYKKSKISEDIHFKEKISDNNHLFKMSDYNNKKSFTLLANDYNYNDAAYLDKEKQNIL